jgi:hypothetical protein
MQGRFTELSRLSVRQNKFGIANHPGIDPYPGGVSSARRWALRLGKVIIPPLPGRQNPTLADNLWEGPLRNQVNPDETVYLQDDNGYLLLVENSRIYISADGACPDGEGAVGDPKLHRAGRRDDGTSLLVKGKKGGSNRYFLQVDLDASSSSGLSGRSLVLADVHPAADPVLIFLLSPMWSAVNSQQ